MLTRGDSTVSTGWPLALMAGNSATEPEFVFAEVPTPRFVVARWRRRLVRADGPLHLSQHLLSYCERGGAVSTIWREGERYCARQYAGSVTFLPAGRYERWMLEAPDEVVHLHLYIAVDQLNRQAGLLPIVNHRSPWLDSFFRLLLAELEAARGSAQGPAVDLLDRLGDLLLRRLDELQDRARAASPARVPPLRPHLLRRVLDHVDNHLGEPLPVAALADMASLSVDHFVRAFTRATGATPHRWLQMRRLEAAATQLRHSELRIDEIAHRCGFAGAAHFAASFRRHHGVTPSQYRRSA